MNSGSWCHRNHETSLKTGYLQIPCEIGYLLHNILTFVIKVMSLVLLKSLSKMDIFLKKKICPLTPVPSAAADNPVGAGTQAEKQGPKAPPLDPEMRAPFG